MVEIPETSPVLRLVTNTPFRLLPVLTPERILGAIVTPALVPLNVEEISIPGTRVWT